MTKHGNGPVKAEKAEPAKSEAIRPLAARKTGSTVSQRQQVQPPSDDEDTDMELSQLTRGQPSPDDMPDLFQDHHMSEDRQVETSQAAQRRATGAALAAPNASRRRNKRMRNEASTPSVSRSKQQAPPKPQAERVYNSIHHFLNDVKAYSEAKSPSADLRRSDNRGDQSKSKKKGAKFTVLECSYRGCPFRIAGKTLQDAKGRELEGFRVDSVRQSLLQCDN